MTKHIGNRVGYAVTYAGTDGGIFNAFSQFFLNSPRQNSWQEFSATGGNVSALAPGNGYKYHTFTSPGTFTVREPGTIEVLMVGGGGAGGSGYYGGGGGAGGLIYYPGMPITAGSYPITIGGGGAGVYGSGESGANGNPGTDTTFSSLLTAKGGGGGGGRNGTAQPGGSSGGVGYPGNSPPATQPAQPGNSGTYGFGNRGGGAYGGGGGGAGKNGGPNPGLPAPTTSIAGGDGLQYPAFTGPLIGVPSLAPLSGYFAGGGGGGAYSTPGAGGLGGGGVGDNGPGTAAPGTTNSGGGGGGIYNAGTSGAGGNGIVVIRYLV